MAVLYRGYSVIIKKSYLKYLSLLKYIQYKNLKYIYIFIHMNPPNHTRLRWLFSTILLVINILRPRQNCCHFIDNILKCILLNKNVCILFKVSLKFVPKFPITSIPALVQTIAWRRPSSKPLSEPMMWRIYASLGLNGLILMSSPPPLMHMFTDNKQSLWLYLHPNIMVTWKQNSLHQ